MVLIEIRAEHAAFIDAQVQELQPVILVAEARIPSVGARMRPALRIDPAMGSAEEIMNSLWVRARLVARNNKALIQTVAGRLDRYGFYTGEEIQRILDESMKGLDR